MAKFRLTRGQAYVLSACAAISGTLGCASEAPDTTLQLEQSSRALSSEEARAARQREVDEFYRLKSRSWKIIDTRESSSGEIIDYVTANTLYPNNPGWQSITPPDDVIEKVRGHADELAGPNGSSTPVRRGLTEIAMEPELRPPPGTVPVERNGFLHYIEHGEAYTSLYDFISQVATPTPQARNNRLYGTQSSSADNTAIDGFINLWKSIEVVEPEMSLLQAATDCGSGSSYEAIEIGFQVNPALYDDNDLHLFTYFRTAGGATGPLIGGYNEVVSGFQRWTGATSFPGAKISASTLSAFDGPQYECEINVTLGSDGLWWLYACDNWLGFYPTQLANHPQVQPNEEIAFDFLHLGACGFQFFGEVVDTTPNNWTSADMGRAFPEQGYRRAAYIREPQYWDGSWHWMPNNPYRNTASGSGYDANCYRVSDVFPNGGTGWARWFYTGGPGGNSPGCT